MPQPTCAWQDLSADFDSLTREASVLNLVASAEGHAARAQICEALEDGPPNARVIDSDLRGYHGNKPGWIADRICCLLTAAEICRMLADREPASLAVRDILEAHPATKRLIAGCRSLNGQSQGLCQCRVEGLAP
jgi:hypothetical protein